MLLVTGGKNAGDLLRLMNSEPEVSVVPSTRPVSAPTAIPTTGSKKECGGLPRLGTISLAKAVRAIRTLRGLSVQRGRLALLL